MAYKSKYRPTNISKYRGNPDNIVCRSMWERYVCGWLDQNSQIKWWSSEEIYIMYYDVVTGRNRRYYPDFYFETLDGVKYIIEVKPKKDGEPSKSKYKNSKRYLRETTTYATNMSKWQAAKKFTKLNNINFQVWDENILRKLGIMKK